MKKINPSGSNSNFTVYYHNSTSDTLSLSFILDGDAARINLFNEKPLSNLTIDPNLSYVQSMAGYKANISLQNINLIKEDLDFFFSLGESNGVFISGNMVRVDNDFVETIEKLRSFYDIFSAKWAKVLGSRKITDTEDL